MERAKKDKGLIHRQLEQLGISHFKESIEWLMAQFESYPWHEKDESIETEVKQLLLDLLYLQAQEHITPQDICVRWRIKVANLRCWKYRAFYSVDGQRIYWDPLKISFASFCAHCDVQTGVAETEYPAKDIIRFWCKTEFGFLSQ